MLTTFSIHFPQPERDAAVAIVPPSECPNKMTPEAPVRIMRCLTTSQMVDIACSMVIGSTAASCRFRSRPNICGARIRALVAALWSSTFTERACRVDPIRPGINRIGCAAPTGASGCHRSVSWSSVACPNRCWTMACGMLYVIWQGLVIVFKCRALSNITSVRTKAGACQQSMAGTVVCSQASVS